MTATFNLSTLKALPFDFETEVAKFVQAKKDHLTTEGQAAPSHHQWVEAAVRRIPGTVTIGRNGVPSNTPDDFVADYAIVDDTPPPPTLDERKQTLANNVNAEAFAIVNKIMPPLKQKLFSFRLTEAMAVPAVQRTDAHNAIIDESLAQSVKTQAIYRHAAELESQIHDLTEDQVDVWKGAPFPS